ncbi:MAG: transposase, partial [Sphingomonas sp.]|nr:transposase [Sphingomonas sp.]
MLDRYGEFGAFLGGEEDQQATCALRRSESTGRPAGSAEWLTELERSTGRTLMRRKP